MSKKVTARKKLTRQEQRDLDVEISFMQGIVRRDPAYVEALQILGDALTRRGKYAEGLHVDQQLARLCPDDSMVFYNLACSYALTHEIEQAVAALSQAIDRGYSDFKWLVKDPDLQNLRLHPLFKEIQAKIRQVKIKVE